MAKNKIPENMTLNEASEFWDEHSFLDHDFVQEVQFSVDLRRNRNYIDLREDLAKKIRMIAHQKGTSSRTLVNQWLREKVAAEQHSEG